MDIREASIIHHIAIVLALIWILSSFSCCNPIVYFISLIYLYQIHERYNLRLRRKLQYEERKQANQRRPLAESETVRWLNHAVEKVWPICMEQIASQKILLPIIPWFLEKYKPWTAKQVVVQQLYLGRNPPTITEMRVLRQSSDDDHLVLELGINFLTADDMSAILAVKLRRRLGFGMWTKLHMTGMHVEGKVLVGLKFLRQYPYLGRLRLCFVEPPYFQMTVKPIFSHGLDVTELPGIAGWLDKLLAIVFEQTLVEPNMLVVDVEKFASATTENWFSVDEKDPIAYAKVEIVEGADMQPSDSNGLADPYVKGQVGPYRFRTKTQKKTLSPKWLEEFRIPICTWESPNVLTLEVCDKDHFRDDTLGDCSINITDFRSMRRHDMWLPLQNIKMGRLHLAVTVLDANGKEEEGGQLHFKEPANKEESTNSTATAQEGSDSAVSSVKARKVADEFEPINIEGQERTGIWVHHPGSDVPQIWEPRRRKSRLSDIEIHRENNVSTDSSAASGSIQNSNSNSDENADGNRSKPLLAVRRVMQKMNLAFHRTQTKEDSGISSPVPTPRVNLRAVNERGTKLKIIMDDNICEAVKGLKADKEWLSPERNEIASPGKGNAKGIAPTPLSILNFEAVKGFKEEECLTPGRNEIGSSGKGNVKGIAKRILKHVVSRKSFSHGKESPGYKEQNFSVDACDSTMKIHQRIPKGPAEACLNNKIPRSDLEAER
ncbi:C2 calcium-dependent membrane targeting [Macleaya cordata]|uniref:C2 calcium-dependent membrane targeting n=1 Tax=Macleaya cordata TaxID=56857 RepID=A0A200QS22_MACCD|nr:C2 calcium-dependent membrane targeting [Macleaya cordata]